MKRHGLNKSPIYRIWAGMKARCNNVNIPSYGGRGIRVCEVWASDFMAFHQWAIEQGWKKGLSIERINNDLGYCPENCKLIPRAEQPKNRRNCIYLTAFGKSQIIADWSRDTGINHTTIKSRLKLGWTEEQALSINPVVGGWIHRRTLPRGPEPKYKNNFWITYENQTRTLSEWAQFTGIDKATIGSRIRRGGWSIGAALTVRPGTIKAGAKTKELR